MQQLADELLGEVRPPEAPRAPLPPARSGAGLQDAWPRLGLQGVGDLLAAHSYGEWTVRGDRLEGPCPQKRGRCAGDRGAAYVYTRQDGGPPFVHCSHKSTCGFTSSVFELVAARYPERRDATSAILRAAGIDEAPRAQQRRHGSASLEDMPGEAWKWAGCYAHRKGKLEALRGLATSDVALGAIDEGARLAEDGGSFPRPSPVVAKRIERAIRDTEEGASPKRIEEWPGRILSVARRTAGRGRGARFEVEIEHEGSRAKLSGIDGASLDSYPRVRAAALEEGLVLPRLGRAGSDLWCEALREAMATVCKVEETAPDEDVSDALEQGIRMFLRTAARAEDASGIDRGEIFEDESGRLLVNSMALRRAVRKFLDGEPFKLPELTAAARRLGLEPVRRKIADSASQLRLWSFPSDHETPTS